MLVLSWKEWLRAMREELSVASVRGVPADVRKEWAWLVLFLKHFGGRTFGN